MPRKRKDPEESGLTKPEHDTPGEDSIAKVSPRPRAARPSPSRAATGARKTGPRQTNATPEPPAAIQTDRATVQPWTAPEAPVQPKPVQKSQPGPAGKDHDSAVDTLSSAVSLQEQIALLAYSYWEARGRQPGNPEEDWFRAEREVLKRSRPEKR